MATDRYDLYGPIHKGLRLAHADMLTRLGRTDFAAPDDALRALRGHLAVCRKHLAHEDAHIHPLLEARLPGGTAELERQHAHHGSEFDRLEAAAAAVERAATADRAAAGRRLYLAFTAFVAADLAHMHHEETEVYPRLCALFADAELAAIEGDIVATLSPEENVAFMRLIVPAISRAERAALLGGIKAAVPAEAFAALVREAVAPTLAPDDLAALGPLARAA